MANLLTRFAGACAFVLSHQSIRCLHIQSRDADEGSDQSLSYRLSPTRHICNYPGMLKDRLNANEIRTHCEE